MKEVLYRSTRGGFSGVKASEAILQGLAEDGGLFVPETMPVLDVKLSDLAGKSYQEVLSNVVPGQNNPYPLFTTYSSRKKNGGVYYTRSSNMSLMHYFEGVDSAGNWTTVSGAAGAGMVFGFCL